MTDILIVGNDSSPALRHEIPLGNLFDPIAYLEVGGECYAVAGSEDVRNLEALGRFEVVPFEQLELAGGQGDGRPLAEVLPELVVRACQKFGLKHAAVPAEFSVELADYLRAEGIKVEAQPKRFTERRRVKSPHELEGIRRAVRASELAIAHVQDRFREAQGGLTADELRTEVRHTFAENNLNAPWNHLPIAAGASGADPRDEGRGVIPLNVPVVVDFFPRDLASGCWADMCRSFCVGEAPSEFLEWHEIVGEALRKATATVRAGVSAREVYAAACDVIEEAGYPTLRRRQTGQMLTEGFTHSLGHGLGLELHEAPFIAESAETLVAGEVLALEPGLYRPGFGGCRIEDDLLVTDDGCEVITKFSYDPLI
jgi:Xaa-Pro aminopeptidase